MIYLEGDLGTGHRGMRPHAEQCKKTAINNTLKRFRESSNCFCK
jgi:hypothetical protein